MQVNAQISINGMKAHHDKENGYLLFSISDSCFNNGYTGQIICPPDSLIDNINIDGTKIGNSDSIVFDNINAEKAYRLTITYTNSTAVSYNIHFTTLPIIHLYGNFGNEYSEGSVDVCMPGQKDDTVDMLAKVKWRGGTTNTADKNKRNYHIKFLKKDGSKKNRTFFGFRKDNDWLLDACQIDYARCRNRIATELWQDFATPPYYADISDKVRSYVRGKMAEVFLNDEYRGIYAFTEDMDDKQMDVVGYDFTHNRQHGAMWKSKSWSNATMMWGVEEYDNSKDNWMGFYVESPDFDDVCPTDYSLLHDAVRFVATSTDKNFETYVSEYFDVPVLVDYYLFLNLTMAADNAGKNMYWSCYDRDYDKRLTIGVWDLDVSFGQTYNPALLHPADMGATIDFDNKWNAFNLLKRLIKIPSVQDRILTRYWELRDSWFATDSLILRFSNCISSFINSGAALRETNKWSGDSDLAGNSLNFEEELSFISQWITTRCEYLDKEVFHPSSTSINKIDSDIQHQDNVIYNLQGQRMSSTSNLPKGIYIKNGKKFLIGK